MSSIPEITVFKEEQRQQVIKLWETCGLLFPGNDPDYDIDLKIKFQPGFFFIMLVDGKAAGSVMAGSDGHRGWLNYLCVHPDYRNMGHGKKLVSHAVLKLKETGCPKVNLQIRNNNTGVVEFYKKAGFYVHDVMCMQLKI